MLSAADKERYHEEGYLALRGALASQPEFQALKSELALYAASFLSTQDIHDTAALLALDARTRGTMYRGLRYLPALLHFSGCSYLCEISRSLGLALPAAAHSNNIRMDLPSEDQHLFAWHQDITYLLGSANAVTYWIPLGKCDVHHGSITLIPGSHKRGMWPYEILNKEKTSALAPKDIQLTPPPSEPGMIVEAELGDIVIFSQLLLHASTPNRSDVTRWTIQVRHSDFLEPYFREEGFPMGDATTIARTTYMEKWTQDHGQY